MLINALKKINTNFWSMSKLVVCCELGFRLWMHVFRENADWGCSCVVYSYHIRFSTWSHVDCRLPAILCQLVRSYSSMHCEWIRLQVVLSPNSIVFASVWKPGHVTAHNLSKFLEINDKTLLGASILEYIRYLFVHALWLLKWCWVMLMSACHHLHL